MIGGVRGNEEELSLTQIAFLRRRRIYRRADC